MGDLVLYVNNNKSGKTYKHSTIKYYDCTAITMILDAHVPIHVEVSRMTKSLKLWPFAF